MRVGHWTGDGTGRDRGAAPGGTIGSGEVRGGAPATREIALLDPTRTVERVDAVVLTGGSAFGLAAADGVMRFLAERGQGSATAGGAVPIVPAAAIFDLVGRGRRTARRRRRRTRRGRRRRTDARSPRARRRRSRRDGREVARAEHATAGGLGVGDGDVDGAHIVGASRS